MHLGRVRNRRPGRSCYQLTKLCELGGSKAVTDLAARGSPDEAELNMILNLVVGIKPKNEMQAALAAQMVAVHLMTMKLAEHSLMHSQAIAPQMAAVAGKLARTFALQTETLAKLQGRVTTRQKITVRYENHEHQHVHMTKGRKILEGNPTQRMPMHLSPRCSAKTRTAQPCQAPAVERDASVPNARRKRIGRPRRHR